MWLYLGISCNLLSLGFLFGATPIYLATARTINTDDYVVSTSELEPADPLIVLKPRNRFKGRFELEVFETPFGTVSEGSKQNPSEEVLL